MVHGRNHSKHGATVTDDQIKAALPDHTVLSLTLWAEARGDWRQGNSSVEERIAVGCVIRNRVATRKQTYRDVCLSPAQFSCWTQAGGGANYAAVMSMAERLIQGFPSGDPILEETAFLAGGIISGVILDRTNGASSYYAPKAMKPPGRVPGWAVGKPNVAIGEQIFLHV